MMKFTATKPRTRYEMLLEARKVRPQVEDHAIKVQIRKMIRIRLLKPLGTRPSQGGPRREVPRYVLSEAGAKMLSEV